MPRLNLDDSLWSDSRYIRLLLKIGDEATAIGHVILAFRLAQKHWLATQTGIPEREWKTARISDELIECGLAVHRENEIYVCGTKEHFDWLLERRSAGRKGGKASAEKRKEAKETKAEAVLEIAEAKETKSKQIQASSSSSSSFSNTNTNTKDTKGTGFTGKLPAIAGTSVPDNLNQIKPIPTFIGWYVKAYQARYGPNTRPSVAGKVQGQIKRFLEETPLSRACDLIQVYCQMDDAWFKTKCHDFGTFIENLNKVGLALDTGQSNPGQPGMNWDKVFGDTHDS